MAEIPAGLAPDLDALKTLFVSTKPFSGRPLSTPHNEYMTSTTTYALAIERDGRVSVTTFATYAGVRHTAVVSIPADELRAVLAKVEKAA